MMFVVLHWVHIDTEQAEKYAHDHGGNRTYELCNFQTLYLGEVYLITKIHENHE